MLKSQKNLNTEEKILDFVKENYEVSTKDIIEFLEISPQETHKHLNKLVTEKQLEKMGRPPKVFYKIFSKEDSIIKDIFSQNFDPESLNLDIPESEMTPEIRELQKSLEPAKQELANMQNKIKNLEKDLENFIFIKPEGSILTGLNAFDYWCQKRNLDFKPKHEEYLELQKKYQQFKTKDSNFIIATDKFKTSFKNDSQVDEVYYCDFYSIEIFGKTKLGSLLLHGKQSQNQKIINQVCFEVKDRIIDFIQQNKIDAAAFIPPTTPRKPQFMDEFRKILNLSIPIINLEKIINDIAIQQKTLKSSADRIENARNTIFVDDNRSFKNILLLDDAVGSGSTFNEIARKIRRKKTLQKNGKVCAIAIVGSANGIVDSSKKFEVISEV